MTTAVLAAAWAGLVLAAAHRREPGPQRRRTRALAATDTAAGVPGPLRRIPSALGSVALRLARRPIIPATATRLGHALLGAAAAVVVLPAAAPVVAVLVWAWPALGQRRCQRRLRAEVLRHLPEVTDLFVLAVGAGLTVPLAVSAVGRRAPGPMAPALRLADSEVRLGRRLADALDDIPGRLGEDVRPLIAALVASERYGAPLLDSLLRLSVELRAERRRRAEEAARRVPVKLLFPLVFCTLPAFALLTVAPLLAGSLRALRL